VIARYERRFGRPPRATVRNCSVESEYLRVVLKEQACGATGPKAATAPQYRLNISILLMLLGRQTLTPASDITLDPNDVASTEARTEYLIVILESGSRLPVSWLQI